MNQYILNGVNYPEWFIDLDKRGKIIYNRDNYNRLVSVKITDDFNKKHIANIGDLILYQNGMITVISKNMMKGHII